MSNRRKMLRFGDTDVHSDVDNKHVQMKLITSSKVHPWHLHPQLYFDIAVLTFDKPLRHQESVTTLCLPEISLVVDKYEGHLVTLTGNY